MPFAARTGLSRRHFLAGAGLSIGASGLPAVAGLATAADGFRVLRAQPTTTRGERPLWGYGAAVPGPTLRCKRGEELRVRLVNDLSEPTSVHWHGVRAPNAMDGVPHLTQPPVAPGATFDYVFRPPDAGTFWYHAFGAGQVDRGLYGALIVEEPDAIDVDRDLLLVFGTPHDAGGAGPLLLVNGSTLPDLPVKTGERLRLRLINATSARGFSLRIDGLSPWVMAIDGQPAEQFVARDGRIVLAPGSRVDLFIDTTQSPGTSAAILAGLRDEQPVARLVYESGGERSRPRSDPRALPANPLPARIDLKNALRFELALGNARAFDPNAAPLFTVRRGRPVTLALRNPSGHPHVLHVHGHSFRLLDRLDDGWKPYWLDTLLVGERVDRIAFVADNPGKWLIDGRMLERPDSSVGAWFAVT
jgi:FtsP/CotA-like multicopper oxidase with cupredoxin domain